jgi:hypothetical protein
MQIVPPALRMEVMMQAANTQLKSPVNLRTVLDAVNPDEGLRMIDPVENAVVAHTQFAKASQLVRHADQPPVDHNGRVLGQPLNLPLDAAPNHGIEAGQLPIGPGTYFDPVGHTRWRGVHGLN